MSLLDQVVVVLYEPQDPVNIAATARAMKNMGVSALRLVRPVAYEPERLEFIADTYLSVSTPVQWAASGLLAWSTRIQSRIQMRCRRNLAVLRRAFGPESAFRVLNVEGGWYAIVQAPRIRSEEEWVLLLLERHGVLVQPGFFYDFEAEAFLVVSLLTPKEVFSAGIKAWATGVAAHAPLY